MRIALCISGFLRSCDGCVESLRNFILRPFNPDVFISTWEAEDPADQSLAIAEDLYRPKAMETQVWPNVLASWGDLSEFEKRKRADTTVPNVLGMFYKIYRCNQLKKAAESTQGFRYDVVVRLRTDLMFFDTPPLQETVSGHVAIGNSFGYGGLPDLFAYGDSMVMDVYSDLVTKIPQYISEGCVFHPEMLLEWHVKRALPQGVVFSSVPYRLVRPSRVAGPIVWRIR
jgi:hypothetical protein